MTHKFKSILLATVASGFLVAAAAPASFAAGVNTQAFGASVATQMTDLGMQHFDLKALTYDQLLQIETIAQASGSSAAKKDAIDAVLAQHNEAVKGATKSKYVPSSMALRDSVVAGANANGVTIAKPGNLTLSQLEQIETTLATGGKSPQKADEIKNILNQKHEMKLERMQDTRGMRENLVSDAKAVGVDIKMPGKLTVDQVDKLKGIFNSSDRPNDKAAAVQMVLSH